MTLKINDKGSRRTEPLPWKDMISHVMKRASDANLETVDLYMDRFAETETAVIERLRALKASPDRSINLLDIHTPLEAAGFSDEDVAAVLNALEQDRIATLVPGHRLLILKDLPEV